MKEKKSFQNFIKNADSLLSSLSEYDQQNEGFGEDESQILAEIDKTEIDSLYADYLPDMPGKAEIIVSEDDMSVRMNCYPPQNEGEPLLLETVNKILVSEGIVFGVIRENIEQAISTCNLERIQLNDILVAEGVEPQPEIPEHLVIIKERSTADLNQNNEDKRVDYREITPFIIVKKNEVLAKVIGRAPGSMGTNVKGVKIPYKTRAMPELKPLKNTIKTETSVLAAIEGSFVVHEDSFWVNPVLEIRTDVDYSTGNINFPGDVIINGEVHDRFSIKSAGSLYCYTTLDAWDVVVKDDIKLTKGIIGRKEGKVTAGGTITTKFIENCYVKAKKSIFVKSGILNSSVNTLDKVKMGGRGLIVGGKIVAQNGVEAVQIGSEIGTKTEIVCGTDFTVKQYLLWIKENNLKLAGKLAEIEKEISRNSGDVSVLEELRTKIKKKIHELNETALSRISKLDKNDKAEVTVFNTVYPGVQIEICHIAYVVTRILHHGRFSLDKESGKIVFRHIL